MDSAEFDVIMHGEDDGVSEMTEQAAAALDAYNEKLADMARQEAANERLKELKQDFAELTDEQKQSLIAADDQRQALEDLARAEKDAGEAAQEQTTANKGVSFSMADVNGAMQVGQQVLAGLEKAYAATVAESQKYAHDLRDLMSLTGQNSGETARLVQTLDDYEVSVGDIEAAMKKMTANGLTPNLDTIGQLSDRYNQLNDPVEKTQFLYDNLGKAGTEWQHVMEAGNATLRDKAAAVNENLILSDRELANAEALRISQDDLSDATAGLSMAFGTLATPAITDFSNKMAAGLNGWGALVENIRITNDLHARQAEVLKKSGVQMIDNNDVMMQYKIQTGQVTIATQAQIDAAYEQAKAEHGAAAALESASDSTHKSIKLKLEQAAADRAAKDAAAALSQTYTTELSLATSLQSQQNSYTKSSAALKKELNDLLDSYNDLDAKGYAPTSKEMVDIQKKIEGVSVKTKELADANGEAMSKFAYDNLLAKASVGGLTDAEFEMAQKAGVSLGIFTQATADQAVALNNLTSEMANGKISQGEFDQAVKDGTFTVKDANDKNKTSYFDYVQAAKEKLSDMKGATEDTGSKATESANVTKDATERISGSWGTAADGTRTNIGDMKGEIDSYISKINEVPPSKNTQFTADFPDLPSGSINAPLSSASKSPAIVNYYIQTAIIGENHELRTIV